MKIISSVFLLMAATAYLSSAQCDVIKSLHFPYEKGLVMSLKGKNTEYDRFNFPLKTVEEITHYTVTENKLSGTSNSTKFVVNIVVDKDTVVRNHVSPLLINNKGMSWAGIQDKKVTQAILLPLQEGKKWTTSFGNQKHQMTCFTTDTTIALYVGNVRAFGISYEKPLGKDDRFDYFEEYREWYNDYIGKVASASKRYGVERATQRVFVLYKEESTLNYTNITEDKIKLALAACK